jgi:mono/diheme cytochrome c family protein
MSARSIALALLLALPYLAPAPAAAGQASDEMALRAFYDLEEGKRLYGQYCQFCHGERGKGKAYNLVSPPPPDLTAPAVQRKSDADLAKVIHEGEQGTAMGAWKWTLSEREKQNVLLYLRQLAR